MTRVVIVTSAHAITDKRVFQRHALFLSKAGYDVHLVGPGEPGRTERDGISIHGFSKPRSKLARLTRLSTIYRLARSLDGDIYHLHDPDLLAIGWRLQSSLGVPVVYDAHEDFSLERNVKGVSGLWGRLVGKGVGRLEQLLARRLAGVVCPHRIRLEELRNPLKPSLFLPNYPPKDIFERLPTNPIRERALVYSGLLSVSRGAKLILDAAERMPDVRFVLLAKFMVPAEADWFSSELTRRELSNVSYEGFVPFAEIPIHLSRSAVGIMPWLPTPQHLRAAQPSKLYEYMACALPVLAADLPITREVVGGNECGLLHEAGEVDSFVAAAHTLLNNPSAAAAMGKRGYLAFRDRYSYESAGGELIAMYDRLLAGRERPPRSGRSS